MIGAPKDSIIDTGKLQMMDPDLLTELTNALFAEYSKPRDGIHISDMLLCPRKTVFQKLQPIPLKMKELNFFTSGRAIHEALQRLALAYPNKYDIEKEVTYHGCTGHVDIYDRVSNIPVEAKSMRKAKVDRPKDFHVEQIKSYMAILGADNGFILYQLLLHFDETPFVVFPITMTARQREIQLQYIDSDIERFKASINNGDPSLSRHIANDARYNWLCNDCKYYSQCESMRKAAGESI